MIWFTADQHFCHDNIIKYCHRPFNDVGHMNRVLIERWNEKVGADDVVYVLGDFSFKSKRDDVVDIINSLKGTIFLIPGGHDKQKFYIEKKFLIINPLVTLKAVENKYPPITLCHYCLRVWNLSHYNAWHLYGHSHGNLPSEGKSHDVGVDNNNFFPLSLDDVIELMKHKPDNFNLIKPQERKWYVQEELQLTLPT